MAKRIYSKFPHRCSVCGANNPANSEVYWDRSKPRGQRAWCISHGDAESTIARMVREQTQGADQQMNSTAQALYDKHSKTELEAMARADGWRGDAARLSKEEFATLVALKMADGQAIAEYAATIAPEVASTTQASTLPQVQQLVEQDPQQAIGAAIAAALAGLKLGASPDSIRAAVKAEIAPMIAKLRAEVTSQVFRIEVKLPNVPQALDVGRQHKQFPDLVKALAAGCNVWLVGPAAAGKTTAAEAAALALKLNFSFDGALDNEYKVIGFVDAGGKIVSTSFRRAYTEGGLHLFDECDASLAPATLAINAALANGYAAFPDGMQKKHPNFRCIAAANTIGMGANFEYVGRNKMDAAFLDRFVTIKFDYDESLERFAASQFYEQSDDWVSFVQNLRVKATAKGIKVIVSPRASIFGCQLLAGGMDREKVIDLTLRNKMRAEDWKAITS